MKKLKAIYLTILMIVFASGITGVAQTQTVTLIASNNVPSSFNCSTNQVITINSFIENPTTRGTAIISYYNGFKTVFYGHKYGEVSSSSASMVTHDSASFTGVANVLLTVGTGSQSSGDVVALTITVTTPTAQSVVPANTVVIPTDATGPVQIVLESSSDLLNWTSSLPGTYGNTYSNRFFRVRAIAR